MLDERLAHSTGSEVRRLSPGNTLTVTQNPAPTVTTPTVVMSPDRAMSASTLARLERSVPTETRRAYSGDWARFSTWCAEPVSYTHLPQGVLIVLVRRGSESFMPQGSTVITARDQLLVAAEHEHQDQLEAAFAAPTSESADEGDHP